MRRPKAVKVPTGRYTIHWFADSNCTFLVSEPVDAADTEAHARALLERQRCPFGAAIVDNVSGLIEHGYGFGMGGQPRIGALGSEDDAHLSQLTGGVWGQISPQPRPGAELRWQDWPHCSLGSFVQDDVRRSFCEVNLGLFVEGKWSLVIPHHAWGDGRYELTFGTRREAKSVAQRVWQQRVSGAE